MATITVTLTHIGRSRRYILTRRSRGLHVGGTDMSPARRALPEKNPRCAACVPRARDNLSHVENGENLYVFDAVRRFTHTGELW